MQQPSLGFAFGSQHLQPSAGYVGGFIGSPITGSYAGSPLGGSYAGSPHSQAGSTCFDRTPVMSQSPSPSPEHGGWPRARGWADGGGCPPRPSTKVAVIAPGGGTGINKSVYAELSQDPRFNVEIVGRSRAPYDCYPPEWSHGRSGPNLATFADEVLRQGTVDFCDCLVVGSRGGQVVLPALWNARGDRTPPAVVINGGCAMNLPSRTHWPRSAATFLLIGGKDYFRGDTSVHEYVAGTKSWVPPGNCTTAILYVDQMQHMPQGALLGAVLPQMVSALSSWKATSSPPLRELRRIIADLKEGGWSGMMMYTRGPGQWVDVSFSPHDVKQQDVSADLGIDLDRLRRREAVEFTREHEMKALWGFAAQAVATSSKAPPPPAGGGRFHGEPEAAATFSPTLVSRRLSCPPRDANARSPWQSAGTADEDHARSPGFGCRQPRQSEPAPFYERPRLTLPIRRAGTDNSLDPGATPPQFGEPGRLHQLGSQAHHRAHTPISRALGIGFHSPPPSSSGQRAAWPSPLHCSRELNAYSPEAVRPYA